MTQFKLRGEKKAISSLAQVLGASPHERLLFICAHDDDTAIGVGMLLAQAVAEGFAVSLGIVSDGSGGYCTLEQRENIAAIRAHETTVAYKLLGLEKQHIHFLGFPDASLQQYIGRRKADPGETEIGGYTGLENHLTCLIRKIQPHRIFVPAGTDLHLDHQAVYRELLISIFHAAGDIWPDLGAPCQVPQVYEYPIYVNLDGSPEVMLEGDAALFDKKLAAISAYASQRQIKVCVDGIREAGAVEFFRNLKFEFYKPAAYRGLFA